MVRASARDDGDDARCGRRRDALRVGDVVEIALVKRPGDGDGTRTARGEISDFVTNSSFHADGIKVRLRSGEIGRVTRAARAAAADGRSSSGSEASTTAMETTSEDSSELDVSTTLAVEEGAAIRFHECREYLNAGRAPFVSPEVVAHELSEGVASGALGFTAGADQDVVSKLYEKGFVKAFETARDMGSGTIYYMRLGWGSEEAPVLAEAIKYAHEHCKAMDRVPTLSFSFNEFTDEDKQMLMAAAGDGSRVKVEF